MDLPPIKLEVLRLGFNGEPNSALCRPATPGQMGSSLQWHVVCMQADRFTIVEPPTRPAAPPVVPPPPL